MRYIFKYEVTTSGVTRLPTGATIYSAGVQDHGDPSDPHIYVWALVEQGAQLVDRRLRAIPTGMLVDDLPATAVFVGTVHMLRGTLVFHVFDCGEVTDAEPVA